MKNLIQRKTELKGFTYYKIGGKADYYAAPHTREDLREIKDFLLKEKLPYFVLGLGSNVLIPDEGIPGLVIHLNKLNLHLDFNSQSSSLIAGCSVPLIQALRLCMREGLAGFERLVGIPGSIGGIVYMNAGTHLGEVQDILFHLTTLRLSDLSEKTYKRSQMKFSYRRQHFLAQDEIIYEASFSVQKEEPASIQKKIQELLEQRKAKQPIEKPSCGSVFKNPDPANGLFAWKLIDEAGLRGLRIGSAQVSPVHTNFIVNCGGARAADVVELIQVIKEKVHAKFGVCLEEEVQILSQNKGRFL